MGFLVWLILVAIEALALFLVSRDRLFAWWFWFVWFALTMAGGAIATMVRMYLAAVKANRVGGTGPGKAVDRGKEG